MANNTRSVLVVGLGRFGSSVATTLDTMGQDVLAVDKDGELVNRWSSQIPTVQADMTDVMALEQINASDFDTAVVAIGDSVERPSSPPAICWTRASPTFGRSRCPRACAHSAAYRRTAHHQRGDRCRQARGALVSGNYLDYIELEGAYSVVKIHTPRMSSVTPSRMRAYMNGSGITVVGVKSPGKEFEYGSKELIMHRNDELIIMGKQDQIDKFLRG